MFRFIAVRAGQAVLTLWAVTSVVFLLVRLSGDPAVLLVDVTASEAAQARISENLGLDDPLPQQYGQFLRNVAGGDLGESIFYKLPVVEMVTERLWKTTELAVASIALSMCVGVPLGVLSAQHRHGRLDRYAQRLAYVGMSAPPYWLGLVLVLVFAVHLDWVPTSGYGGVEHLVLPTVTLSLAMVAGILRLTRSAMLEALASDYVTFARGKGLAEASVVWKHALRNAAIPTVTFGGILFAQLLAGATVVETVFAWPGLGELAYRAVLSRDYPLVQGVILVVTLIFVVVNLLVDLVYGWLDPRIRLRAT